MDPNTPSIPVTLGPLAQRLAGLDFSDPAVPHPSIIFCDSAMLISELHTVLGGNMDSSGYSVCEALSPKHGQKPFLFGTTWIESQIIDHHKNVSETDKGPSLEAWSRGVEGRSLVNQYDGNRACSYLFQTFTVEEKSVFDYEAQSEHTDVYPSTMQFKKHEPVRCPKDDQRRNDFRIQGFIDHTTTFLQVYPRGNVYFYLRSDALVGRMKDLRTAAGGQSALDRIGTVMMGYDSRSLRAHLRTYLNISTPPPTVGQPKPHPYLSSPPVFEWSKLDDKKRVGYWRVQRECQILATLSARTAPKLNSIIRVVPDTNVHSHRYFELRTIVSDLFTGNIMVAALPEIVRELHAGEDGPRRAANFRRLMTLGPSTEYSSLGYFPRPLVFRSHKTPQFSKTSPLKDLRIRGELVRLAKELERNHSGKVVVMVFLTIDYGCQLLVESIPVGGVIFICVRVGDKEKGTALHDIIRGVLAPYVQ